MCGVSVQTVSRVINGRPDVSAETRAAVEAAIADVGFQPSAVARSLVQRRSNTLGLIAAGLRYFGVGQTLNGITEESEELMALFTLSEAQAALRAVRHVTGDPETLARLFPAPTVRDALQRVAVGLRRIIEEA